MSHIVHWGIKPPFLGNPPSILVFRETPAPPPPPLNISDFSLFFM